MWSRERARRTPNPDPCTDEFLNTCSVLTLQEQLQARRHGQFGDLADARAVRKLCRVLREEKAIFELQVSNRRECRRRRYRGSARISLWLGCRSRLCRAELSKDAQHAKQENRDDLQSLSSEKYDAIYFRNKCGTYQRV